MAVVNLRAFRSRVRHRKTRYRRLLNRITNLHSASASLDKATEIINNQVWREVDCLSCGNCCKLMSPTYKPSDIRRIAAFLGMPAATFREKWLFREKSTGDWLNKSTPCQFLDLQSNKCKVYEVRPSDCSGFPHLTKKRWVDYVHVHKQNLELCPATFRMVEKMQVMLLNGELEDQKKTSSMRNNSGSLCR